MVIVARKKCVICSVRKNFEGHAGLRTRKSIWIAGPASQLLVLRVGMNIILTNYCQSNRTCKCFICQSTPSIASLGPRTCKFRRDCICIKHGQQNNLFQTALTSQWSHRLHCHRYKHIAPTSQYIVDRVTLEWSKQGEERASWNTLWQF